MKIKALRWKKFDWGYYAMGVNQNYIIRAENKHYRLTIMPHDYGRPILQDAKTVEECKKIAHIQHEESVLRWFE
ncbi:hypothetical protein C0159_08275 [Moraxella catarrhalis]|uniref:Uncharacterized protein n=1 Tax=Moraxella catarrhalis TaxID=480 RepID=A0A3Q9GFJ4_MORCA|nr:hypothetical protein [Moraxella catarrhalis]AZQ92742.1 hypothetical protein EJK53_1579 [Moraxella catarrhalis]AZQ94335.1 hypothetical protein EJK53_1653 [Moraxella catarrhalis]MDE4520031.1 hypothetical protein [Moraxella catarrhalis]MPW71813.1 hypothetical protein [Moraxella catarrhalis]MPX14467.1 hypothetical protein [Moraxella catarrhalis]